MFQQSTLRPLTVRLTALLAVLLMGAAMADGHSDAEADVTFQVASQGMAGYTFEAEESLEGVNPTVTLERGKTYAFEVAAPGHPFYINTENTTGASAAYEPAEGNGTSGGTIILTVPDDAPDMLYYNCSIHAGMNGVFEVVDAQAESSGY